MAPSRITSATMYSKILRSSLTIVKIPNRSQEISSVQSFTRSSINYETTRTLSQEAKYKRMPGDTAAAFVDFSFETITEMIEKTCEYHAENPMFGTKKGSQFEWMTYKEFYSIVGKTRNVLHQLGLKKNDKVSIISNNRWEWASMVYSTMGIGGQIVPMYEAQLEEDWKYIIQDSESKLLVVSTEKIYEQVKDYPLGRLERLNIFFVLMHQKINRILIKGS